VAIANALQLEADRATPGLFRFNYDAMPSWLTGVWTQNFTKLGEDMGQSFLHNKFVSVFGYLLHFQTRAARS